MTFSNAVNSYDAYARSLSVHRWSSLGYSKTDNTDYYDSIPHWVLGQIKRHYNADTNIIDVRNEYDPYTDLPVQTYAFEKLKATMTYNVDGTLATSKDGNNNTTNYSNWMRGIPQTIQFADGTSVSASVDGNGWIRSVTDENGYVTGYGYDAMGRVSGITYPNEANLTYNTTTITFLQSTAAVYGLPAGHWEQVTQTGNRKKVVYFDGLWRPVVEENYDTANVNGTLSQAINRYDTNGRVVFQAYPQRVLNSAINNTWGDPTVTANASGVRTSYDALGRVTKVQQDSELGVLTITTEYLTGLQVRTTNSRGYQATNGYQAYDQPSYDLLAWSAQPEGKTIEITHNYFGMPGSIKQHAADNTVSVTRTYVYDGNMQLCKTIEPEVGSTVMSYDAAGNLAWSVAGGSYPDPANCNTTDAYASGRRADRTYNTRNRVTLLAFPDGRGNQSWTYTPDGLVSTSSVDNDGPSQGSVDETYSYNHRRLLAGESMSERSWYTWSLGYGYDANGNLSTEQYPNGLMVSYSPNALGQATSVASTAGKVYASGVSYYPNGGISQFTYGNGIVHTMTQNARQLPSRSTDAGIINYSFTYDGNANPTLIADDQRGGAFSRWMNYDGLDRLTGAGSGMFGGTDNWHHFTYNALDNITSWKLAGVKDYANYIYDASNRLTNIQNTAGASVVALAYDLQGNLQNKNGQAYSFDYGNRLRGAANQESYRYDAQGRRILQWGVASGKNILSMYSMGGKLMYMEDDRRSETLAYIYLGASQVARVRAATSLPMTPTLTAPATNAGGSYALTWSTTAITDYYVLEESTNGGSTWATLYNGTATNAAVSGRAPGSYAYRVKACNTLGCSASSATSTVQVLTAPAAAPAVSVPSSTYTGAYAVTWTTVASASSYILEESLNGGAWTQAYNGASTASSFSGRAGGNYSYRAKACNIAGCGPYSATGTILVLYTPTSAPSLTVPANSYDGSYTVSWGSVATADHYELQESANGGAWTQVYSGNTTSQGFSGRTSGSYGYQVRACNAAGCGPFSASGAVSVTITPATPTLSGSGSKDTTTKPYTTSWDMQWTASANATSYQLEHQSGTTVTAVYSGTNTYFTEFSTGTTTYSYHVRACNGSVCSAWSAWYAPTVTLGP
ncbi:RHS Repeat-containing protein [Lysobacter silvestris]|uniref:RHS Repeat-containing protein n=1 Tax=Solilutibacter silvestris TaxID=1645665 RepID=A0A2K1Q494_9GAMM|nr:RHS Repeat-containing protein [Lysobacter silvestris]